MTDEIKRPGPNEVPRVELDIVFEVVAHPVGPPDLNFVEVECGGRSVRVGRWVDREDGYRVLRIPYDRNLPAEVVRLLDTPDRDEIIALLIRLAEKRKG